MNDIYTESWYIREMEQPSGYHTTYDKDTPLHTFPHYTDARFDKEQTVFGKPSPSPYGHKELAYDYSDRLWQWDWDKADKAQDKAGESEYSLHSCHWYEVYLSAYFGRDIVIEHIVAEVNKGNGYPYCVFGYHDMEGKSEDSQEV